MTWRDKQSVKPLIEEFRAFLRNVRFEGGMFSQVTGPRKYYFLVRDVKTDVQYDLRIEIKKH